MTTSPTPLPPELLAKATRALRNIDRDEYTGEKIAEIALLAADVPGLIAERDEVQRQAALHKDMDHFNHALLEKARAEAGSLREHLDSLIFENGLTASQLRARIQLLVQRPDGTPSARVRALIDANHALTQQRDEARTALAVALHIIGDADKILTDEYGDYGPLAKRVTDVKEHARRVLGGGGRVTNLEKTLESDSDTLRNEIARLLVQTEAQRNAIDGLRAAKAELARQVEDLREELSELADAGIEKVLALEAELATLRKSRNHYLNAWLSEQLEDLRPTLSALSEAIEARRMRGKEGA